MNDTNIFDLATLVQAMTLIPYSGCMNISIIRVPGKEGAPYPSITLQGEEGVRFAQEKGVTPCEWYGEGRPQRTYEFKEGDVKVLVIETAPEGWIILKGELIDTRDSHLNSQP